MDRIAAALIGVAARVRFLSWGERDGDDAVDYFARGGTVARLSSLVLETGEPLEDVDPADLLNSVAVFIGQFIVVTPAQADALALWTLHTHTIAAADVTPFIAITSAEMRSGKSRLLEVLGLLVCNPWTAVMPSEAVLFRKIEAEHPTLLLDEFDGIFQGKAAEHEPLRALLNAGNRRGTTVDRCVKEKGGGVGLQKFSVFCPRALAGIGRLPGTIADRSMPVRLRRRTSGEPVERLRRRRVAPEADKIRAKAEQWAAANVDVLRGAEPPLPEELDDRAQDGAEPLLAIADLAGGSWPERARRALVELCAGRPDDDSLGIRLLRDCRTVFESRGVDRLSSKDLLASLREMEEAPWAEINGGKGLTKRGLARMLSPYEITSGTIRLDDGTTPKGYYQVGFEDAWGRFLPPSHSPLSESGSRNAITPQGNASATSVDFSKRHSEGPVADEKREIVNAGGRCGVVAFQRTLFEREPEADDAELL